MSNSSPPDHHREHPWHAFVVPATRGLEGFLWRVAWLAVFVKILLFS